MNILKCLTFEYFAENSRKFVSTLKRQKFRSYKNSTEFFIYRFVYIFERLKISVLIEKLQ